MTTIHVRSAEGRHHPMTDGDHVAKAAVTGDGGAFEVFEVAGGSARFLAITTGHGAGRFFADFAQSVRPDAPPEESMETILSVTRRHGVALAGA